MFGGAVAAEHERREMQRIQRRRERNEARRLRLLNARQRVLGVDKAALDMQVQENQARKLAEKETERVYGKCASFVHSDHIYSSLHD